MSACFVNAAADPGAVPAPSTAARAFHEALPGYAATPVRDLPQAAAELGVGAVIVKDESARLGLPAFKVLGASWAVERALAEHEDAERAATAPGQRARVETLVAASAGNHGRAVAHVAAQRGLRARIFLPARSLEARRVAIAAEGADVVVVDGGYEDAVAQAVAAAGEPGALLLADVGDDGPARWVIDGYATLFAEAAEQAVHDLVVVPVGVGSLAAAAARHGAATGVPVIGAEPVTAACLTASLRAGHPATVATPGTTMAGLDCAEVSPAAWPALREGIRGTVTVDDAQARAAMDELAAAGMAIGESGAAPLAALRVLAGEGAACRGLREAVGLTTTSRVLLIATEGLTGGADAGVTPAAPVPRGRRS